MSKLYLLLIFLLILYKYLLQPNSTVEDTDTSFEELEKEFGINVKNIVAEVTDDKALSKEKRKLAQVEHALHLSPQAALVKFGDFLYNLTDLKTEPLASW